MKGIAAYQNSAITTQSKGRLIILLYDGAIKFVKLAIKKMEGLNRSLKTTSGQPDGQVRKEPYDA